MQGIAILLYIRTLIFRITIAVINKIISVQNINTKMAKDANGACSLEKHLTVPSTYHLCTLNKRHIHNINMQ